MTAAPLVRQLFAGTSAGGNNAHRGGSTTTGLLGGKKGRAPAGRGVLQGAHADVVPLASETLGGNTRDRGNCSTGGEGGAVKPVGATAAAAAAGVARLTSKAPVNCNRSGLRESGERGMAGETNRAAGAGGCGEERGDGVFVSALEHHRRNVLAVTVPPVGDDDDDDVRIAMVDDEPDGGK